MLDFSFYCGDKESRETIDISEDFHTWLTQSEFSKIGKSKEEEMKGDGEAVTVSVVPLEAEVLKSSLTDKKRG